MSADLDELIFEKEWRKCFPEWGTKAEPLEQRMERLLAGFEHFCTTYWHIKHPSRGRIKFEMRDAQRETIECWMRDRMTLALKARQVGFSTLSGAFAFWLTFGYADRNVIMLSRNEREAAKLLAKSRYGYRFLPSWMKLHPKAPVVAQNTVKMTMTNESYIESLPSASDPARGESVFLVIVDEIGFLPNSDDAWASIEPVADVGAMDGDPLGGGRVIMLGTANGEGNLLHTEWVKSRGKWGSGIGRFLGIFFSWRANSERDDAWYEAKKADLPEWQLAQEYPDNPDEAFLKSGRPVFNLEKIRAYEYLSPEMVGFLQPTQTGDPAFVDAANGFLSVWKVPNDRHRYCLGADVAEGLEHGDYSSIHVIDCTVAEIVAHWHGHVDPDLFGSLHIPLLGRWYNNALAVVEANNHGLTTLTALQRVKYHPIYRRRRLQNRVKAQGEALGWMTTPASKPLAIDELGMELRQHTLTLWDASTAAELRTYVREGDGKMHGSPHDDRVMSLALANQGRKHVNLPEYRTKEKAAPWSMDWLNQQFKFPSTKGKKEPRIGSTAVYSKAA